MTDHTMTRADQSQQLTQLECLIYAKARCSDLVCRFLNILRGWGRPLLCSSVVFTAFASARKCLIGANPIHRTRKRTSCLKFNLYRMCCTTSDNNESGILEWSNTPTGFTPARTFHFSFNTFNPSIEEDIVAAALAGGFDPTSKYVLFIADSANCQSGRCNNDHLVWKGAHEQPSRLRPRTWHSSAAGRSTHRAHAW
jgi:hypothetical protein